ncbi:hypothetical protein HMPREF0044_0135 [Gleimia coleocanis DSM 15436]|uniref:Uncharacterized protein n=1 Tax=Gleimia coleocanis DSM 15436 TaxID=525245 RepID=C0VY95_9ACTO|nr:hypothetical protein [Gleimia coleocanis]EEH64398.1 hypothetical protein HMPREF0044_0135 [Gleimia coleocanis DSM 15436]
MGRHTEKREEYSVITPLFTPKFRRWTYGIATATVPLLVVYGVLEESVAPLWLALVGQIFATGTAYLHTPAEVAEE